MKYLKSYNESLINGDKMQDVLTTCSDVLYNIKDEWFDCVIGKPSEFIKVVPRSWIIITKKPRVGLPTSFKWSEIKDTITQLVSMVEDTCTYDVEFYDRSIASHPFYSDGTFRNYYHNDSGRSTTNGVINNVIDDDTVIGKFRITLYYHPLGNRTNFNKSKIFNI